MVEYEAREMDANHMTAGAARRISRTARCSARRTTGRRGIGEADSLGQGRADGAPSGKRTTAFIIAKRNSRPGWSGTANWGCVLNISSSPYKRVEIL